MLKYVRLFILLGIAGALALTAFPIRLRPAEGLVREFLERKTGLPCTISTVTYRFPVTLTINDIRAGNALACRSISVVFNPLSMLLPRLMRGYLLTRVIVLEPRVTVGHDLRRAIGLLTDGPSGGKIRTVVSWVDAAVVNGSTVVRLPAGYARMDGRITGKTDIDVRAHTVSAGFSVEPVAGGSSFKATVNIKGPVLGGVLSVAGRADARGNAQAALRIQELGTRTWMLRNAAGTIVRQAGIIRAGVRSPGVQFNLAAGGDQLSVRTRMKLSALSNSARGDCAVEINVSTASVNGTMRLTQVRTPYFFCEDADLSVRGTPSGVVTGRGSLLPAGYTVAARYDPAAGLSVDLTDHSGNRGKIFGTITPLRLTMDIPAWGLAGNPFSAVRYPGLTGTIAVRGDMVPERTAVHVDARDVTLPGMRPQSFAVDSRFIRKNWFFSVGSMRRDATVRGAFLASGIRTINGAFSGYEISNIVPWLTPKISAAGTLNGTIQYSSRGYGATDLFVQNAAVNSFPLGSVIADLRWDPTQCAVRTFALRRSSGTIIMSGTVPLQHNGAQTSLSASVFHYPLAHVQIDGKLTISGLLDRQQHAFNGVINGTQLSANGHTFTSLEIPLRIGRSRVEINNASLDSMLSGHAVFNRILGNISGGMVLNGVPLDLFSPAAAGRAYGTVDIDGTRTQPRLNLRARIKDGRYRSLPFTASGTIQLLQGTVLTDGFSIVSGKGSCTMSGKVWPRRFLKVDMRTLRLNAVRAVLSAGGAGTSVPGAVSGTLRLTDKDMTVDEAVIKEGDSECRLAPGSTLSLDKRTFTVMAEVRNAHVAGADIFGKLQAVGAWSAARPSSVAITLTAHNLWINQLMVPRMSVPLSVSAGKILLKPVRGQVFQVAGSIDTHQSSRVRFNDLTFSAGARKAVLTGVVGKGTVDLRLTGSSVSASLLSSLAGLPMVIDGETDIDCTARGDVSRPEVEGSVAIGPGLVNDLPFDAFATRFYIRQDVLTIQKAQLAKQGQYTITTNGFMPLAVSAAGKKRTRGMLMNLTANLEQGDLGLLPNIFSDIRTAGGAVSAQLRLAGTPAKPIIDGYVKVTNAFVDEKRYFGRLKDISADIAMKDNIVTVNSLRARGGNGAMRVKGTVAMDGLVPVRYDLSCFTEGERGVPLVVPELPIPTPLIKNDEWRLFSNLSHGEPTFMVSLNGPAEQPLLSGWVVLEKTRFTYPSIIKKRGEASESSFLSRLKLNLELRSGKNTWYDNQLASVQIRGTLRLDGPYRTPLVAGAIDAERGAISYFGAEFDLTHASLELVNRKVFVEGEATANVYAATDTGSDTITMVVEKSELSTIKPRFVSQLDPALTSEQALAKATGIAPGMFKDVDRAFIMRRQLIRLVDSTLATPLARSILRRSGIADSFKVQHIKQQPITPDEPSNPTVAELLYGTKYSMGKNLTNQLQLGYSVVFDELNNKLSLRHAVEMSYRLQPNTFLKGSYELDTHNPLRQYDKRITLEQQWRFNLFGSHARERSGRVPSLLPGRTTAITAPRENTSRVPSLLPASTTHISVP